ncbi:MAG: hypothetical protein PVJ57_21705 [Phycisphaerae bacterium]|jgi:hypothetical protein
MEDDPSRTAAESSGGLRAESAAASDRRRRRWLMGIFVVAGGVTGLFCALGAWSVVLWAGIVAGLSGVAWVLLRWREQLRRAEAWRGMRL